MGDRARAAHPTIRPGSGTLRSVLILMLFAPPVLWLGLAGCMVWGCPGPPPPPPEAHLPQPATAPEDMLAQHGVVDRMLDVYAELSRQLEAGRPVRPETVWNAAGLVQTFVEGYHEKLEEDLVFVRFEAAGRELRLIGTLRRQHRVAALLNAQILLLASRADLEDPADRARLAADLRSYVLMYRPHTAREDTVIFPELREVATPEDFYDMGVTIGRRRRELFGPGGYERIVERVADVERVLGIHGLEQFTPGFRPATVTPRRPRPLER